MTPVTLQRNVRPAAVPVSRQMGATDAAVKRTFIQRLFTTIAPRYDWFNRLASCGLDQRWRRAALTHGDVRAGQQVLDVCTGTGDLALLCAARQAGQGRVIGMDLNREMLAHAHQKQRARGAAIAWVQGDAEKLPFADERFDRVVIGFSTRNLSDLTGGLGELIRVLRPSGRLVILETGRPAHPVIRAGYRAFLLTAARLLGLVLTGRLWPFTYLAGSVRRFLTPQQMVELLKRLQTDARHLPLSRGLASLYVAVRR
jgi:demethylmenaquinone methyltransferase/2-methoxy-6-polyprenyl-1,4-benzoquinol methylase